MGWMLVAWLCAMGGDCRPVQAAYPTRGACLKAERVLKHSPTQLKVVHCHMIKPPPES